jgi:hypothetical protein
MRSFCCIDNFMMQMIFYMNVVDTKVVYNSNTLFFLKFHDFRPNGLGAMDFTIFLSGFACSLCISK